MRFEIAGREAGLEMRFDARTAARIVRLAGVAAIALTVANCSQQKFGGIDPKYGVAASPKVIRDGDPVPKGGGREMVGKPYTVAGRTYVPTDKGYVAEGLASWYGVNFHGRLTANGEVFDRDSVAAAHTTMPLPSYARVTNLQNGHSIIVRVNDRGPFHGNRIIDVSQKTAEALDFMRTGTARVRVEYVGRASTNGSDDRILLASLRTDGTPASLTGGPVRTLVASNAPRATLPGNSVSLRSPGPAEGDDAEEARPAVATPVAARVPLPPERPFDLGTIPSAASPIGVVGSAAAALPPARPVVAGLYFAPAEPPKAGLARAQTFQKLEPYDFVTLKQKL